MNKKLQIFGYILIISTLIGLIIALFLQSDNIKNKHLQEFETELQESYDKKFEKRTELQNKIDKLQKKIKNSSLQSDEANRKQQMENSEIINHAPIFPYLITGEEAMFLFYLNDIVDFGVSDKYTREFDTKHTILLEGEEGLIETDVYLKDKLAYIIWQGKVFVYKKSSEQEVLYDNKALEKINYLNENFSKLQENLNAELPQEPTKKYLSTIETK